MAQYSEIFGPMIFAQLGMIFLESQIQDPMQAIFNPPMTAFTLQETIGLLNRAGDIVVGRLLLLVIDLALVADHQDRIQFGPIGMTP